MNRWFVLAVLTLSVVSRGADLPPERGVILDIARNWYPAHWPNGNPPPFPHPTFYSTSFDGSSATFTVGDANARDNWLYQYNHPVDPRVFPICTLRYKATNIDTTNKLYAIWIDDTTGPANGKGMRPFMTNQLVADGKEHSLTTDLRKFKPPGISAYMTVAVKSNTEGGAKLKILELRFEAPPDANPQAVHDGDPIKVLVQGPDGKPIAGATVTSNADWVNYRRTVKTDDKGLATVTPYVTDNGNQMLLAQADGLFPTEVFTAPPAGDAPITMMLHKIVHYSGTVTDELGEGVGAKVTFGFPNSQQPPFRLAGVSHATTDAQGKWTSPDLPDAPDLLEIAVTQKQYGDDGPTRPRDVGSLADGSYITILKKKN